MQSLPVIMLQGKPILPVILQSDQLLFGFTIYFGLAWRSARCPPRPLYHSLSSAGQGRGNMMKGSRVKIRTGRDHSPITIMDKTD